VTSWLQEHGFEVAQVSKGRTLIEFSGTAAQVQEAFHTPIQEYAVKGEAHWANASNPEIPEALAPVVAGLHSLHNSYKNPQLGLSPERGRLTVSPGAQPQVTFSDGTHALGPADYRLIYNAIPTLSSGINGQGQTIAVVARSNLFNGGQDVYNFRNIFRCHLGCCSGALCSCGFCSLRRNQHHGRHFSIGKLHYRQQPGAGDDRELRRLRKRRLGR
jgi:subtilase family serine protease